MRRMEITNDTEYKVMFMRESLAAFMNYLYIL